jgi:hypothetical protein
MESMRGFLILLAALGLLAGEPAIAAPSPPQGGHERLDFPGLLYQWEQSAGATSADDGQ